MTIHPDDETIINLDRPVKRRRILLLSLEFNFAPFSGNGVLARSLGSSLVRRDDCIVRVVCAKPHPSTPGISQDMCMTIPRDKEGSLEIWPVELPQHCQWKRLDRSGPWEEYASACGDSCLGFASRVKDFEPTDIICVDWHGSLAWKSICRVISQDDQMMPPTDEASWKPCSAIVCYYNFRVYSSSSWEHSYKKECDAAEQSDDQFYRENEQLSCHLANAIICLAEHDKCKIQILIEDRDSSHEPIEKEKKIKNVHILHPPLRGDIWELASMNEEMECFHRYLPSDARYAIEKASSSSACNKQRLFITCMTRLSPEKSPHNFVTLLQKLGGIDFLRQNTLIPIICGARSVEDYAKQVVDDFEAMCSSPSKEGDDAWPCVVIDRNLGPQELAAVFSRTAVNVHPCLYDSYGMTLVESAAFGVPSVANNGGKIGATALLGEGKGCIAVDLEQMVTETNEYSHEAKGMIDSLRGLLVSMDNSQKKSESIVETDNTLRKISREARSRALGWDEMACCQGLIDVLNGLPMG